MDWISAAMTREAAPGLRDLSREFITFLKYNRNVSPHTTRAYDTDVSQFLDHAAAARGCAVSELQISDFDTPAVRGYLDELHKRGNSRTSAARRLSAVRMFAKYLVREERLSDNPAELVVGPKRDATLPEHLSGSETEQLLAAPDASTLAGRRDRAILELFYASGLRLSELVDVDLEDINLNSRVVRVRGKGRKERLVPFNSAAADRLQADACRSRGDGVLAGSVAVLARRGASRSMLDGGSRCS